MEKVKKVAKRKPKMEAVKTTVETPKIPVVVPITVQLTDKECQMLEAAQAAFNAEHGENIKELQVEWGKLHQRIEQIKAHLTQIDTNQGSNIKSMLFGILAAGHDYSYADIETAMPTNDPTKVLVILKSDIAAATA